MKTSAKGLSRLRRFPQNPHKEVVCRPCRISAVATAQKRSRGLLQSFLVSLSVFWYRFNEKGHTADIAACCVVFLLALPEGSQSRISSFQGIPKRNPLSGEAFAGRDDPARQTPQVKKWEVIPHSDAGPALRRRYTTTLPTFCRKRQKNRREAGISFSPRNRFRGVPNTAVFLSF